MNEKNPNQIQTVDDTEKEKTIKEAIAIVLELNNQKEIFQFPGIEIESYERLKKDDDEFPGFTTHIDKIIERMQNEGMKIVLGKNPNSGNIFVLPAQSNDIENDSIQINNLQSNKVSNTKLLKLISLL